MDALVIHAAGDLRVEDVPTPQVLANQLRVRVRFGGICGSDLHYYQHGGFGTVRVKEPMVLGHEVAGVVEEVGPNASAFAVGDRIAISPSRPCGACRFCQMGLQNHCLDMRYYGSAMRTPHVQGAFRRELVVETSQAHRLADTLSDREGAMAEPCRWRCMLFSVPVRCSARRCSSPAVARSARCWSLRRGAQARATSSPPTSVRSLCAVR